MRRRFQEYTDQSAQQGAAGPGMPNIDPEAADFMMGLPWLPVMLPDTDTAPVEEGSYHLLGLGRVIP